MAIVVMTVTIAAAAGLSILVSGARPDLARASTAIVLRSSDLVLVTPAPGSPGSATALTETASPSSALPLLGIRAQRIQIPRLNIDLKIIDGDGIDAPMGKAAHYPGAGWPYGGTNIYIYAHAQTGMFLSLWDATIGDQVVLTLTDGSTRSYVVDTIRPKVPWNALDYLKPTPTEQLTLQTSTSYYSTAPRFIVIAHPAH